MSYKIQKFVRIFTVKSRHTCIVLRKKKYSLFFSLFLLSRSTFHWRQCLQTEELKGSVSKTFYRTLWVEGKFGDIEGRDGCCYKAGFVHVVDNRGAGKKRDKDSNAWPPKWRSARWLLSCSEFFIHFWISENGFWYCNLQVRTFFIKS